MTNKEWMATLTAEQFYDEMLWLIRDFGFRFNNTRLGIIDWLDQPYRPEKNYKIINANTINDQKDYSPYILDETPKPITNADRLRTMSDAEIADFLCDIGACDRRCPAKIGDCFFSDSACRSAWRDWLK